MKSLVLDGKKFIKASEAAQEHGYTNDYIGQLCRGNKVDAQLVGRTWYVSEESLLKHRKERYRSNQKKAKEEVKKVLNNLSEENSLNSSPRYYNRLVSNLNIEYTTDNETDLIPTPNKIKVQSEEKQAERIQEIVVSETAESEAEYHLDTVYKDIPKSGVLTIVEDETEAPTDSTEADSSPVKVRLLETKIEKPHKNQRQPANKLYKLEKTGPQPAIRTKVTQIQTPANDSARFTGVMAPLSVSLLAGLAIAMLMVSLSWQFHTDANGFSERYRLNMSSLMYQ